MRRIPLSLPRVRWLERDNPQPSGEVSSTQEDSREYHILTRKEREVMRMHEEGISVFDIAKQRVTSPNSVKRTIHGAKKKLALRSGGREYIASSGIRPGDDTA